MSVDSILDGAMTTLLAKARQRAEDQASQTLKPATFNFEWTGGGVPIAVAVDPITLASAPSASDPILLEAPFAGTLVWAHLYAGDAQGNPVAVSAIVDVQLTRLSQFGTTLPLYGNNARPALVGASSADIPLTGWIQNLLPGDALIGRLRSFSGLATWVSLNILVRPTEGELGLGTVTDALGITLTDAAGNVLVIRS